jgi:hypothetical protein
MAVQQQQGFVDPRVDYRHTQLMSEVAQRLDGRQARRHTVRSLLIRSKHVARELVGTPRQFGH